MNRIVVLLFLCLVPLSASADDVGTLMRLEHQWLTASASGNRAELERLLHPDFVDVTATGRTRSRNEVLDAPALPPGVTQALQDLQVRVFNKTAVVTGVNVVRTGSSTLPTEIMFTDVYLREGRDWRAISAHHTVRNSSNVRP